MKRLLLKFWAPLLLVFLSSVLFANNYSAGTFLSGWDNLHPEFNPLMNLERAWQSAWQEYQGLGLLAGMAHSADLFRQVLFLPMALLLPNNLFRYVWHFLMILVGVLSSFYLIRYLLAKTGKSNLIAFLGASFYLLNFGTVQNFYVTFEPFAAFYAFLPWLLLLPLKLLKAREIHKKDYFLFVLLSILSSSMFYVQTIFVVYLVIVSLLFLERFLQKKKAVKRILLLFLTIIFVNLFWFLNAAHFAASESALLEDSKGKAMSNEVLALKNQSFGDVSHVIKLQGFWLNESDFDQSGNAIYLFDAWKTHFSHVFVQVLLWFFVTLLLLGLAKLFREKIENKFLILTSFLLSFWMLSMNNWPFARLTQLLEKIVPLFAEMFRINFTKWIVPFSLFYSILVAFGMAFLLSLLKKKILKLLVVIVFMFALVIYSWPSFNGHFFYERLRVKIPEAYFEVFDYFKKEAPESSRIANLPQHAFYGWQWNDWGYRGSGFLWYGIKQPILDRAFDVWSETDERYYWQLQLALDKKDVKMIENVLAEYDVDYLLLDESLINRNTLKPFNYQGMEELLSSSEQIELIGEFDFIKLYSFTDDENSREKDFVTFYDDLPKIDNQYYFSWQDQAYTDFHDYLLDRQNQLIYPFASLFTNHLQKDLEFAIDEDDDYFYLISQADGIGDFKLELSDLVDSEAYLPFHLTWSTDKNKTSLVFEARLPEIFHNQEKSYFDFSKEITLGSTSCQQSDDCYLNINDQLLSKFENEGEMDVLLNTQNINTVSLSTSEKVSYFDYKFFDLSLVDFNAKTVKIDEDLPFSIKIPKVLIQENLVNSELNSDQAKSCRSFASGSVSKEKRENGNYYLSTGSSNCDYFYLEQLQHKQGYLVRVDAENLDSLPFLFAMQAESLGRSPLETYLSDGINYQILPPTEYFNKGYNLYLSTDSYGREKNENLLKSAEVFYLPYDFIKSLRLKTAELEEAKISDCGFNVKKKALWLYKVNIDENCQAEYLKLSQAYDEGWLAIGGRQQLNHLKINNWANAWLLDSQGDESSTIYLIFWPQLLEYLGFALLLAIPYFSRLFSIKE